MKIKIDLNLINYFYILFQTYLIYFNFFISRLNNLKTYKFPNNSKYI